MREIDKEESNTKVRSFLVVTSILFFILISRLYFLQIVNGEYYTEKAMRNSLRINILKASRGKIYDRNGKILARNSTGYQLVYFNEKILSLDEYNFLKEFITLNPEKRNEKLENYSEKKINKIKTFVDDIEYMSNISKSNPNEILDTIFRSKPIGFDKRVIIVEDFDVNEALKEVEKIPNERIDIIEYNKRNYPEKTIASHVIGNVKLINEKEYDSLKELGYRKDDLIGKNGIEKEYDRLMKGEEGKEYVEVDVHGNIIKKIDDISSEQGKNIFLSIDFELQKQMTELFKNKPGSFIAMEVKTGKIITFVSSPEMDLNKLSSRMTQEEWEKLLNSKERTLVNKGISGLYPSGSTFKVITGAAILESGISEYERVNSTGAYTFAKTTFRDSSRGGHGMTDFYKAIEESVNTYFYTLIQKIPKSKFYEVAESFGIGKKTGVDIPGELSGVLPTPEWKKNKFKSKRDQVWLPGDTINLSIGQGYLLVTPIQVLSSYQAIANNGVILQPTFIDRIVSPNGDTTFNEPKQTGKLKVSDENIKKMQKALKLPVSGARGTSKILKMPEVTVSAKTGTAQNTTYKQHHSWIAGYFPSDNPEIVFVSLVEGGGYGGVASGNMAREFIKGYMDKKNKINEN